MTSRRRETESTYVAPLHAWEPSSSPKDSTQSRPPFHPVGDDDKNTPSTLFGLELSKATRLPPDHLEWLLSSYFCAPLRLAAALREEQPNRVVSLSISTEFEVPEISGTLKALSPASIKTMAESINSLNMARGGISTSIEADVLHRWSAREPLLKRWRMLNGVVEGREGEAPATPALRSRGSMVRCDKEYRIVIQTGEGKNKRIPWRSVGRYTVGGRWLGVNATALHNSLAHLSARVSPPRSSRACQRCARSSPWQRRARRAYSRLGRRERSRWRRLLQAARLSRA